MINTSDTYKSLVQSSGKNQWFAKGLLTLANGQQLELKDEDFWDSAFTISDSTTQQGTFDIGSAITGSLECKLNNFNKKFSGLDLNGAILAPSVGLLTKMDWQGFNIEWIQKGIFNISESPAKDSIITVTAYDNMRKFDQSYSKSSLTYPATLGQILANACTICGVTLETVTFPNSDYVVTARPTSDALTFHDIVSYVAELAGCYARCNYLGKLEIGWYDFDRFITPLPEGKQAPIKADNPITKDIATSGVKIAGVRISSSDNKTYSSGNTGYTFKIENNLLAQGNLQSVADNLGSRLIGTTFRPYSITTYPDPSIEAGDVILVSDNDGTKHKSIISNLTYKIGSMESLAAEAESENENGSIFYTPAEKAQDTANKAQETADDAKKEIVLAEAKIGDLTVRITVTEKGLESKVSKDDLSTDIEQLPDAVVTAFNNKNGSIQTVRFTGDGFDFYRDGTYIGHMGVKDNHLNFTLEQGTSIQWNAQSDYAMQWYPHDQDDGQEGGFHCGNMYPRYVNMKSGNIMGVNTIHAANGSFDGITVDGKGGVTGTVNVKQPDGTAIILELTGGIITRVR